MTRLPFTFAGLVADAIYPTPLYAARYLVGDRAVYLMLAPGGPAELAAAFAESGMSYIYGEIGKDGLWWNERHEVVAQPVSLLEGEVFERAMTIAVAIGYQRFGWTRPLTSATWSVATRHAWRAVLRDGDGDLEERGVGAQVGRWIAEFGHPHIVRRVEDAQ